MVKLILEENGKRRAFDLGDGVLTVGSGSAAKLRTESADVADVHFELVLSAGSARIEPRAGVIPPTIDGKPVTGATTVAPGARIEVGSARLWIEVEAESGASAAQAARARPKASRRKRSVVNRSRARAKRSAPTAVIVALGLGVVVAALMFLKYGFESEASQGTASVQASIWGAERELVAGNLARAAKRLDDISSAREISPEEAQRIEEIRAEIRDRDVESARIVRNLTGTKFLDVMLKKYEARWLIGTPEPSKVRFYLKRLAEFRTRWPDHPDMAWIDRQESRFRAFVEMDAPPTWEDVSWEIKHGLEQHIRNYKAAFELLEAFLATAEGDDLVDADDLRKDLQLERIAYHNDKIQQARYEYEKKDNPTDCVKWLLHAVIWIGDEEMADQAASFLVKIPNVEAHLRAYETKYPERYAAVLEHPLVHELARRKGLIP